MVPPHRRVFKVLEVEGYVRIPPERFGERLENVALEELRKRFEDSVVKDLGYIVAVFDVKVERRGVLIFGDSGTYHRAFFKLLTFMPLEGEVVEGDVVSVRDIGIMVRVGPINGLVHRVHIMDEPNVLFDRQASLFIGERSKRKIGKGDVVRARITGISYVSTREGGSLIRLTLTMRQPGLGKVEWIKEALQAKKRPVTKARK